MPVYNAEIAEIFIDYAYLLEIDGANQYRVRAYRNAERNIANLFSVWPTATVKTEMDLHDPYVI